MNVKVKMRDESSTALQRRDWPLCVIEHKLRQSDWPVRWIEHAPVLPEFNDMPAPDSVMRVLLS
jgi:hypothetical protein